MGRKLGGKDDKYRLFSVWNKSINVVVPDSDCKYNIYVLQILNTHQYSRPQSQLYVLKRRGLIFIMYTMLTTALKYR